MMSSFPLSKSKIICKLADGELQRKTLKTTEQQQETQKELSQREYTHRDDKLS